MRISLVGKVLCLISILLLGSCYERQEGCLERWASNYDITADTACDDCCTEPDVILRFSTFYDSVSISRDSVYLDDEGNTFQFISSEFFISRFRGWNSEGDTIKSADTVTVLNEIYIDDFFFSPQTSSKNVGFIRDIDRLDTLEFYIGIGQTMQDTSFLTSDDVDLAAANDSLFVEDDIYSTFNTVLAIDTSQLDTIRYRSFGMANDLKFTVPLTNMDGEGIDLSEGLDRTFEIIYFLDRALAGIDFLSLDEEQIGAKIFSNLEQQQSIEIAVIE